MPRQRLIPQLARRSKISAKSLTHRRNQLQEDRRKMMGRSSLWEASLTRLERAIRVRLQVLLESQSRSANQQSLTKENEESKLAFFENALSSEEIEQ